MRNILKQSALWAVVLFSLGVLTLGTHRWAPLIHDAQGVACCALWQQLAPSVGMLILVIAPVGAESKDADSKRWKRDFVLALEKRRSKRRARLAASANSCNVAMYHLVSHRNVQNSCQK